MRRRKNRPRSQAGITIELVRTIFVIWFAALVLITNATAQNYYELLVKDSRNFPDYAFGAGGLTYLLETKAEYAQDIPGYIEYHMLDALNSGNNYSLSHPGEKVGTFNVLRDTNIPMQTAVIFCDPDGNILHKSSNFVYFRYVMDNIWDSGKEEQTAGSYAWFELLDNDSYNLFRGMHSEGRSRSFYDFRILRITGYMVETEIKPVKMDYYTQTLLQEALDKREPDKHVVHNDGTEEIRHTYTFSGLEREGLLEWQNMFDNSATTSKDNLVTIYAFNPNISIYDAGDEIKYQNVKYENLVALLEEHAPKWLHNYFGQALDSYGLTSTVTFEARYFHDYTGWEQDEDNLTPPLKSYMVTAVESRPLNAAISKLRNVYIILTVFAVVGILAMRKFIKRNLLEPLTTVNDSISNGWANIYIPENHPEKFVEPAELLEHYQNTQRTLSRNKDTIARLERALKFAQEAETNRRLMTSNIAHELKTPLAVIHSYAEGLNERIAEDKREKYLGVILSETERMDGMVLEMLDLSRLEAGKVKLVREDFSLSEMAASVFERLELAIAAKNLCLTFDFEDNCLISADPVRIEQVVTNFAVNAVKYTPVGGTIHARTDKFRSRTSFSIENDSPPLSHEALLKVWDTFYSAEASRTGSGTGLGLAIAKSIVELHGGVCHAANTKTGVKFSFTLNQ